MNAEISDYEVRNTFCNGSDTPGPDGISARLIDQADRDQMHACLKFIWNIAWNTGYFSSEWKKDKELIRN